MSIYFCFQSVSDRSLSGLGFILKGMSRFGHCISSLLSSASMSRRVPRCPRQGHLPASVHPNIFDPKHTTFRYPNYRAGRRLCVSCFTLAKNSAPVVVSSRRRASSALPGWPRELPVRRKALVLPETRSSRVRPQCALWHPGVRASGPFCRTAGSTFRQLSGNRQNFVVSAFTSSVISFWCILDAQQVLIVANTSEPRSPREARSSSITISRPNLKVNNTPPRFSASL